MKKRYALCLTTAVVLLSISMGINAEDETAEELDESGPTINMRVTPHASEESAHRLKTTNPIHIYIVD